MRRHVFYERFDRCVLVGRNVQIPGDLHHVRDRGERVVERRRRPTAAQDAPGREELSTVPATDVKSHPVGGVGDLLLQPVSGLRGDVQRVTVQGTTPIRVGVPTNRLRRNKFHFLLPRFHASLCADSDRFCDIYGLGYLQEQLGPHIR